MGGSQLAGENKEETIELFAFFNRSQIGNKNVLSDIATATMLASSAATGASWMVRTNVQAMKDLERAEELNARLRAALDTVVAVSQEIVTIVGERT